MLRVVTLKFVALVRQDDAIIIAFIWSSYFDPDWIRVHHLVVSAKHRHFEHFIFEDILIQDMPRGLNWELPCKPRLSRGFRQTDPHESVKHICKMSKALRLYCCIIERHFTTCWSTRRRLKANEYVDILSKPKFYEILLNITRNTLKVRKLKVLPSYRHDVDQTYYKLLLVFRETLPKIDIHNRWTYNDKVSLWFQHLYQLGKLQVQR